jgi:uncharacterized membrane protein YgcG
MKEYIKVFKIPFLCLAVLAIAALGLSIGAKKSSTGYVRTNQSCTTTERVFDYADKLTDAEEEALRSQIAEAEKICGIDIIIVTLDESLKDYAESYESVIGRVQPYQYTMVYADNFYDENKFGFNGPGGDGVLLLDNWYREADGHVYSWMSTSGRVYSTYSSEMIDRTLDRALENVDVDPAGAYSRFVRLVRNQMAPAGSGLNQIPQAVLAVIAAVAAFVFLFVNHGGRKGKKTVQPTTYVVSGQPTIRESQDQFITRTVTTRRIPRNDGGGGGFGGGGHGGGGGHVSAGGGFHGGGGHSR